MISPMINVLRIAVLILATFVVFTGAGLAAILFIVPGTSVVSHIAAPGVPGWTSIGILVSGIVLLIGAIAATTILLAEARPASRRSVRTAAQRLAAISVGIALLDAIFAAAVVSYRAANVPWFDCATIALTVSWWALGRYRRVEKPMEARAS